MTRKDGASAKADLADFDRVLKERFPAAQEASRALQGIMGFEPGSKLIGGAQGTLVTLWDIPQPPQGSTEDVLDKWKATSAPTQVGASEPDEVTVQDSEEDQEHDDDDDESQATEELLWSEGMDDTFVMYGSLDGAGSSDDKSTEDESEIQETGTWRADVVGCQDVENQEAMKRKLPGSPTSSQKRRCLMAEKPKIVIDLTDTPTVDEAPACDQSAAAWSAYYESWNATQEQPGWEVPNASLKGTIDAASPPQIWEDKPEDLTNRKRDPPIYWSPQLSKIIAIWMDNPETTSYQTYLQALRLGETSGKNSFVIHAENYSKMKATRIMLPPSNAAATASPQMLDWMVIEAQHPLGTVPYVHKGRHDEEEKGDEDGDEDAQLRSEQFAPPAINYAPYWILAFPIEAVTGTTVELPRPQPQRRISSAQPQITRLTFGKSGKVPLVHGRGVNEKVVDEFMTACAGGKGLMELRSYEEIPLHGLEFTIL